MQCPILQLQITDQPESFPNWSSVKFADKYLVFTKTEVDKSPLTQTYVGSYPCAYPEQTSRNKQVLYSMEKSSL